MSFSNPFILFLLLVSAISTWAYQDWHRVVPRLHIPMDSPARIEQTCNVITHAHRSIPYKLCVDNLNNLTQASTQDLHGLVVAATTHVMNEFKKKPVDKLCHIKYARATIFTSMTIDLINKKKYVLANLELKRALHLIQKCTRQVILLRRVDATTTMTKAKEDETIVKLILVMLTELHLRSIVLGQTN